MCFENTYHRIRDHLAIRYGVELKGLRNPTTSAMEYLLSIRAENLTRLYSVLQEYRKEQSLYIPTYRDLLTHMLFKETHQIIDISQISVTLALMLLGDRLSTISVPDSPLIAEWCSKNPDKLSPASCKMSGLSELQWHDLPNVVFHDLPNMELPEKDEQ